MATTKKSNPKNKKEKYSFSAVLFALNRKTANGFIYPREVLDKVVERLYKKPYIVVQEMNEPERRVKKIPIAEPWAKKVMADVKSGKIIENNLVFKAECRNNREGRKLEGIIKNVGLEQLEFFPVGYGTADENKTINLNYKLNYIAVEPKT
jgi:hypothetical protein